MRLPQAEFAISRKAQNCTVPGEENHTTNVAAATLGYTRLVMRFLLFALALLPQIAIAQTEAADSAAPQVLEAGKILPHVSCLRHPEMSYALYLPSNYAPTRAWPLVVNSDPGARGAVPLKLQKDAAERYGYVLVGSNDSRNGPWKAIFDATNVTLSDVQERVSIDPHRIYFAGFSGGARASSQIEAQCKCAAGVFLSGAGFWGGLSPATLKPFPVFAAVGATDFNYSEVIPLLEELTKSNYPHWLRVFSGTHQWAPAEVMDEALAWFHIQEMKRQQVPRDPAFINLEFSKARARADSFEQSGDLLMAWREYSQIGATYDSLVDVTAVLAKAAGLGGAKAVRDGAKREQAQFDAQAKIVGDIASRLNTAPKPDEIGAQADQELLDLIRSLRHNAEQEKHPEKVLVYKRALGGVFIDAMELGNSLLEQKKLADAVRVYSFATGASPDSAWGWQQLAIAQALSGARKQTIAALRRVHDLAADKTSFNSWLRSEHAFDSLRSSREFQALFQ
jgi:dienelactone hydrolase